MEALTLLFLLVILALFWHNSLKYREYVIHRCRKICQEADLQLLDQTVSLSSMKPGRSASGRFCLVRTYQFEVSRSGTDRTRGYIVLKDNSIDYVRIVAEGGSIILQQNNSPTIH